jgi:hypothetical protein
VEDEPVPLRMQMTRRARLSASESISIPHVPSRRILAQMGRHHAGLPPLLWYKGRPEITGDVLEKVFLHSI